jgi:gamma-glutamyltranspeptidase / glutathione hydrolase
MPARGAATLTVPGAPAGWQHLHERYGRLSPSILLRRATELASDYSLSRSVTLAAAKAAAAGELGAEIVAKLFGSSYEQGKRVSNPALAETLHRMGSSGFQEFYRGQTAETLLAFIQDYRPEFSRLDFESAAPTTAAPLFHRSSQYDVYTSPPPTQGFALIRLLENLPRTADNTVTSSEVVEAMQVNARLCNYLRDNILNEDSEPYFYRDYRLEDLPASMAPALAMAPADGDTIGISCVDSTGLSVSWIQSLYSHFGSYLMDPDTGVVLQNRGSMFSLSHDQPNAIRGGAMPPHTLMPVMATDQQNRIRYVQSTMGGKAQPQIHAQVLLRQWEGASPSAALLAPRWVMDQDREARDTVTIEESVDPGTRTYLADRFSRIKAEPDFSDGLGHMQLVTVDSAGIPVAASDPRSDGSARYGRLQ